METRVESERKVMLLLGASSDLGTELIREIEKKERESSQKPLILAHYAKNAQALESLIQECPHLEIHPIQADLSVPAQVAAMILRIQNEEPCPTHIVSFAADAYRYMRLAEWDEDTVKRDMQIQVFSLAQVFRMFLPQMAKRGYGKVAVMLSSCTLGEPPKFSANYTSVKYALLGLMKSAAAEYGGQGLNINGISPEMIETKFVAGIGRKVREMNAEKSPRGRNLTVKDVIPSVLYLLSDESSFVNGSNLNLSGHGK